MIGGRAALLCWVMAVCTCLGAAVRVHAQAAAPAAGDRLAGAISGVVVDTQGELVGGAHLRLSYADGAASREMVSGGDGRFAFEQVMPGAYRLSVTLQGFVAATVSGGLQPGQVLRLAPIALKLATAVFAVKVLPDDPYTAQQQLHIEEKQRLAGFVPNFFVTYQWNAPPLTSKQKFALAWKNGVDPGNLVLVGTVAGVQQADNAFSGYGQGAQGYGKRYGADLANLEVGTFMGGAVLPSLFRQDPRYFYKGTGSVRSRFLYAISRAVICRGDDGRPQPAFASVLGDLSAGAISNSYYPASNRGAGLTLENGFLGVAGDALNGVFQEFFSRMLTPSAKKNPPAPAAR